MVVLEYFRFQRFDDSEPVLQCAAEAPVDVSEWCYPAGIFVVMLFVSFCHQTGKPVAPLHDTQTHFAIPQRKKENRGSRTIAHANHPSWPHQSESVPFCAQASQLPGSARTGPSGFIRDEAKSSTESPVKIKVEDEMKTSIVLASLNPNVRSEYLQHLLGSES